MIFIMHGFNLYKFNTKSCNDKIRHPSKQQKKTKQHKSGIKSLREIMF